MAKNEVNTATVSIQPLDTSNLVIEEQLNAHIEALDNHMNSDCIAIHAPIVPPLDIDVRNLVEWRVQQGRKRRQLCVLLDTGGGYIEVAERIADTFRKHYRIVVFIVPDSAMSAGTVLVMSGDAIYMDYFSQLGPIDPQVQRPGKGDLIPALGYLIQYERLIEKSQKGTITTAELQYLIENFDPAELYSFEQARELSKTLLQEWLAKYKFKNWKTTETQGIKVTTSMRKQRALEIAEKLNKTDKWHLHSRGISMETLRKELNLTIEDFGEDLILNNAIRAYWKLLRDYMLRRDHHFPGIMHTNGRYRFLGEI